ncbi:MAG: hypothetical protein CSA07_04480 [Bacteroidia bacterium]|nr:MAG: hypothetical protein CSA07_04480 [Bacteroidia bacterium]
METNGIQHVLVYAIVLACMVIAVVMYRRSRKAGSSGCGCGSGGCSHGSQRAAATQPSQSNSQVKVFRVDNMRGAESEEAIRRRLLSLDDVADVRASTQQKTVTVRCYGGEQCVEAIGAALEQLGYPVSRDGMDGADAGKQGDDRFEVKVSGMMCGNCEQTVRKALESIEGVSAVEASHASGMVSCQAPAGVQEAVRQRLTAVGFPPVE